jgi:hypothetical protein
MALINYLRHYMHQVGTAYGRSGSTSLLSQHSESNAWSAHLLEHGLADSKNSCAKQIYLWSLLLVGPNILRPTYQEKSLLSVCEVAKL